MFLLQIYTKIHIYAILSKSCCIKQIIIQQIRNQSENDDIPQEPENVKFAPIMIFLFRIFNRYN